MSDGRVSAVNFRFRERVHILLQGNALKHPVFAGPNADQFSSAFGQITATANYARQIQAVLRVSF